MKWNEKRKKYQHSAGSPKATPTILLMKRSRRQESRKRAREPGKPENTQKERKRGGAAVKCTAKGQRIAEGQESTMEEANTKMRQQLRKLSRCWEKESTSQNQSFWLWLSQWWDKEIQSHLTRGTCPEVLNIGAIEEVKREHAGREGIVAGRERWVESGKNGNN